MPLPSLGGTVSSHGVLVGLFVAILAWSELSIYLEQAQHFFCMAALFVCGWARFFLELISNCLIFSKRAP